MSYIAITRSNRATASRLRHIGPALMLAASLFVASRGFCNGEIFSLTSAAEIDARMEELQSAEGPSDRDYFLLGALSFLKRDYAIAPDLKTVYSADAGRYFFQYKQIDLLTAQKNIALFCIDRVRHAARAGRMPGDDLPACEALVISYFDPQGRAKRSSDMEKVILQAMSDELLYELAHRSYRWRSDQILSLAESLMISPIAAQPAEAVLSAVADNVAFRFSRKPAAQQIDEIDLLYAEAFALLDFIEVRSGGDALLERAHSLRTAARSDSAIDLGSAIYEARKAKGVLRSAGSAILVARTMRQDMPDSLDDTFYSDEDAPSFIADVRLRDDQLFIEFSTDNQVSSYLRNKRMVWDIQSRGASLDYKCSADSTVSHPALLAEFDCQNSKR